MTDTAKTAEVSQLLIELSELIQTINHYGKVAQQAENESTVTTLSLVLECEQPQAQKPNIQQVTSFEGFVAMIGEQVPNGFKQHKKHNELSIHRAIQDTTTYKVIAILLAELQKEKVEIIKALEQHGVNLTGLINF